MSAKKASVKKTAPGKQKTNNSTSITSSGSLGMITWLSVLAIILPVIFSRTTFEPVVSIRYLLLSLFVVVFILYYFIIRKVKIRTYQPPLLKLLFFTAIALCLWTLITMFSAINFKESFFEASRTVLNLIFLFVVLIIVSYDKEHLSRLCKVLVIMALVHSFIGILQYYDLAFMNLRGNYKPYGLMANRTLYGSAQALLLPFSIYILFTSKKLWKYISSTSILALTISILLSQTRSAWLSTASIIILSLLLVIIFLPAIRKTWIIGTITYILAVIVIVSFFFLSDEKGNLSQVLREKGTTLSQPLSETSEENTAVKTANERLVIWRKTLSLIKDHKLTGVGPGNWKVGIQAYGNSGLVNEYGFYVLDHAHNVYLQIASETGVTGIIIFLSFWLMLFFIALKTIKKLQEQKEKILIILMLAGIVGFAIDGMFSFPMERIEHTFYLILMAGIILGYYYASFNIKKETTNLQKWSFTPLLICSFILFISKERYDFDKHFYKIKQFNLLKQYSDVITEAKEVTTSFASLNETGDPIEMYTAMAYKELKQYDKALEEVNKAKKNHPYNARVYNTLGTIYTETQNFKMAIAAYTKALSITPKFDVVLKNLAINYYNNQEYAKCLEVLNKVNIENEPVLLQVKNTALQLVSKNK